MIISGCNISDICDAKYKTINTSHSDEIIKAFTKANIIYHAKYDETKLIISYSSRDESRVNEILAKSDNDEANLIERLKIEGVGPNNYLDLLPEISEIMDVSASSLENRPMEIKLYLAQAYIDNWFSDKVTIQKELNRVTELGYYAKKEIEENELKITDSTSNKEIDKSNNAEQIFNNQQHEENEKEKSKTQYFTIEKLRKETRRIKNSVVGKPDQNQELTETEEMTMVRKK